jgi:hypothetical protein
MTQRKKSSGRKKGRTGSAKLEAVAKIAYERKRVIKEDVPADVIRAKAGKWLDLISPITEWAGLKGDALRHKRALLRIEQEETLYKVGLQARARLEELGESPKPIPTKAVIPILEKASLEDPDSELIEGWGNLLASSSVHYDVEVITFAEILSKIGSRERQIIERILGRKELGPWRDRSARATHGAGARLIDEQEAIKPLLLKAIEAQDQGIFEELRRFMPEGYPLLVSKIVKSKASARSVRPVSVFEEEFYSKNFAGFEILKKQDLIEENGTGFSWRTDTGEAPLGISWFVLTELGYAFVKRIVTAAAEQSPRPVDSQ